MSKKSALAVVEPSVPSPKARRFSDEFKRDSVRLVTDERYTFQATVTAVGVIQKSLRDWHAKNHPLHLDVKWMGNSQPVALGHDLQVRDEDYERAASEPTANAVQNPVQSRTAPSSLVLRRVPRQEWKTP